MSKTFVSLLDLCSLFLFWLLLRLDREVEEKIIFGIKFFLEKGPSPSSSLYFTWEPLNKISSPRFHRFPSRGRPLLCFLTNPISMCLRHLFTKTWPTFEARSSARTPTLVRSRSEIDEKQSVRLLSIWETYSLFSNLDAFSARSHFILIVVSTASNCQQNS